MRSRERNLCLDPYLRWFPDAAAYCPSHPRGLKSKQQSGNFRVVRPEDKFRGGFVKKATVLPCILLLACSYMSTMAAAQTSSPVPAGTALMVKLETTLATFSNKPG